MKTSIKSLELGSTSAKSTNTQEPKKLSKFGIWRTENPEGIFVVLDRRAVNK